MNDVGFEFPREVGNLEQRYGRAVLGGDRDIGEIVEGGAIRFLGTQHDGDNSITLAILRDLRAIEIRFERARRGSGDSPARRVRSWSISTSICRTGIGPVGSEILGARH